MEPNLIEHVQWPFKSVLDTLPVALIKYHNKAYIEDRTACRWCLTAAKNFYSRWLHSQEGKKEQDMNTDYKASRSTQEIPFFQ